MADNTVKFHTMSAFGMMPLKEKGWCEKHGVDHAWVDGPTLTSNPPIATRQCANCGKVQHLRPGEWRDAY